jgi:tRNA pseudouridine65 synthase
MILDLLRTDEHIVAVNKPAGLAVHATDDPEQPNLIDVLAEQLTSLGIAFEGPLAPSNRLDIVTSGVVLVPLTAEARAATAKRFEAGEVRKVYLAVTAGRMWPKGVINRPLKAPGKKGDAQEARTRYRLLAATNDCSYIKVQPDTGRTHQIRRHLASIDHPILGDTRHGYAPAARAFLTRFNLSRIMLHARQVSLPHPITGERMHVVATPDDNWFDILEAIGLSDPNAPPADDH